MPLSTSPSASAPITGSCPGVVSGDRRRRLFVTLDQVGVWHTADSLEAAYAGAAILAGGGLEFVLASVPTTARRFTEPFLGGALSATPWLDGSGVGDDDLTDPILARNNAAMLGRLHAAPPPDAVPVTADG